MNATDPRRERPLSPFMLGQYYRLQLTSVLSFLHRMTGIGLVFGAGLLIAWLWALAGGPEAHAGFAAMYGTWFGHAIAIGLAFCLAFHFWNGIRHLFWDIGWGLEIKTAYATGWAVVALSVLSTALLVVFRGGML